MLLKKYTMKKIWITCLLLAVSYFSFCQDKVITTFILVRHAEKDLTQSTNNPDLSSEGKVRATRLVDVLKQTDIQAVYSTDFKRTRQTVEPLAIARSLTINTYDARNNNDIDGMLQQYSGGTILVSGHSNTVPQFINYLIGEEKYQPMGDGEYGNIIIVSVIERGKNAKVVWLKY
jgi:broad specificity phosphatase PhoE